MTTRTDFQSICEIKDTFKACGAFVNAGEAETIKAALELNSRNEIELNNVRDMVVLFYGQWADSYRDKNAELAADIYATAGAICAVIDDVKFRRGMEV